MQQAKELETGRETSSQRPLFARAPEGALRQSRRAARSLLGLCFSFSLALTSACSPVDDQAKREDLQHDGPVFTDPPDLELDPKLLEAFQAMPAPPYEGEPAPAVVEAGGSAREQSEDAAEDPTQKIRNGGLITYNELFANSVVHILVPPGSTCTAQVINKYFLLTAAHCIPISDPGFFATSFQIIVNFTKRDGTRQQLTADGARAYAAKPATGHDIALFYLPDGISTCFNTLSWCKAYQPDIPVNAQFQYYLSEPYALHTNYLYAGYGTTDDSTGARVLRSGFATVGSEYVRAGGALSLITSWSGSQARPCNGDSGGPLIPAGTPYTPKPSPGRTFYTGVLRGGGTCTTATGYKFYTMLEGDDATWTILNLAWLFGGLFSCGVVPNLPANTLAFECNNG